jgi:hypothetical protein
LLKLRNENVFGVRRQSIPRPPLRNGVGNNSEKFGNCAVAAESVYNFGGAIDLLHEGQFIMVYDKGKP